MQLPRQSPSSLMTRTGTKTKTGSPPRFVVHTPSAYQAHLQVPSDASQKCVILTAVCLSECVKGEWLWTAGWASIWYTQNIISGWRQAAPAIRVGDASISVAARGDLSAVKEWGASYTIPENGGGGLYAGNNTPKHSNKEDQMQRSMHRRSRGVHSGKGLTFHINAARKSNVHFVFFKRNWVLLCIWQSEVMTQSPQVQ